MDAFAEPVATSTHPFPDQFDDAVYYWPRDEAHPLPEAYEEMPQADAHWHINPISMRPIVEGERDFLTEGSIDVGLTVCFPLNPNAMPYWELAPSSLKDTG